MDRGVAERAPMRAAQCTALNRDDKVIRDCNEGVCGMGMRGRVRMNGQGLACDGGAALDGTSTSTSAVAWPFAVSATGDAGGVTVQLAGAPVTLRVTEVDRPVDVRCTWKVTCWPSVVAAAVSAETLKSDAVGSLPPPDPHPPAMHAMAAKHNTPACDFHAPVTS